jgi:hypothetical protein
LVDALEMSGVDFLAVNVYSSWANAGIDQST